MWNSRDPFWSQHMSISICYPQKHQEYVNEWALVRIPEAHAKCWQIHDWATHFPLLIAEASSVTLRNQNHYFCPDKNIHQIQECVVLPSIYQSPTGDEKFGPVKTSTYYLMPARVGIHQARYCVIGFVREGRQAWHLHHGTHHGWTTM